MPREVHAKKRPALKSVLGDYPLAGDRKRFAGLSTRGGQLVALGSAAVCVIYAAGYVHTKPAAHRFHGITAAAQAAASGIRHFRDGTYTGWGSCPHGDLQALVVIEHGRIVAATISQCFTRYSKSVIAQLPGQVIARQSPNVDQVSRATESSDAFFEAVTQALIQAQ